MSRPFCQTCASKLGKQLWAGACACTGHVSFPFRTPGGDTYDKLPLVIAARQRAVEIAARPIVKTEVVAIDTRVAFKAKRRGMRK